MLEFLQANYVTIITILVLAGIISLVIRRLVLDKKKGIGPCGKKCSECAKSCCCEQYENKENERI